jgi:hypothetical protein
VVPVHLELLVSHGELPELSEAAEWRVPGDEEFPRPPDGYVISFVEFHRRGFSVPAGDFIRGLLHYWRIELQHLNPNGVLQIAVFVTLCEAYLGIDPNLELLKHYFVVNIMNAKDPDGGAVPAAVGAASVQMRAGMTAEYPALTLPSSLSGWHSRWFYLKDDPARPLPAFTGRAILGPAHTWRDRPRPEAFRAISPAIEVIRKLREARLTGSAVLAHHLARGVAPLRTRVLRMYEMTADRVPFVGTVTAGIRLTETDRFGSSVIRLIRLPANLEPIGSSENSEPRLFGFG